MKFQKINLNKLLITILLTVITLILLKSNVSYRTSFYKIVFEDSLSFAQINNLYEKYFGSPIPFQNYFKEKTKTVFNEKLIYQDQTLYKDGVSLTVENHYLVPVLESGIVIYVGNKENYGKTVIIEDITGLETWYGNLDNTNLTLYDYVEKGNLVGETKDNKLYLVFKINGEFVKYDDKI